jgi:hypothetical protein
MAFFVCHVGTSPRMWGKPNHSNDLTNALFEVSTSKKTIQNLMVFHWTIF